MIEKRHIRDQRLLTMMEKVVETQTGQEKQPKVNVFSAFAGVPPD